MRRVTVALSVLLLLAGAPAHAADDLLTPRDPDLAELSGIAADPRRDAFWVHQDAGKPTDLTLLDSDGATAGSVLPLDVTWEDPEDIAVGPWQDRVDAGLYIADTGDAAAVRTAAGRRSRTDFQISRGELPDLSPGEGRTEPFQSLRFSYPDGANRNVEAMIVDPDTGNCWLVTKTVAEPAEVWFLPESAFGGAATRAELRGKVPVTGVSGAAADPFGRFVVLRDAATAYLYPLGDGGIDDALQQRPVRVALPQQPQGEGITVSRAGDALVVNSEGSGQAFWRVPLPAALLSTLPPAPEPTVAAAAATRAPPRSVWPAVVGVLVLVGGLAVIAHGRRRRSSL